MTTEQEVELRAFYKILAAQIVQELLASLKIRPIEVVGKSI